MIPVELLCRFTNAYHINLSNNGIKQIGDTISQLKCLKKLTEINLSNNMIEFLNPSDLDDDICLNLQHFDLSFNLFHTLDVGLFLKKTDLTQTRFPKLKYFSIKGNRLNEFDILIPLSLPNSKLNFDASSNSITSFRNARKRSFRENPYFADFNSESRLVNFANNQISELGNQFFDEYEVKTASDFEIFIARIANYLIINQSFPLNCKCPSFRQNSVEWFKQIKNFNYSLSIFQLKCHNIDGNPFVFNYTCGVINKEITKKLLLLHNLFYFRL